MKQNINQSVLELKFPPYDLPNMPQAPRFLLDPPGAPVEHLVRALVLALDRRARARRRRELARARTRTAAARRRGRSRSGHLQILLAGDVQLLQEERAELGQEPERLVRFGGGYGDRRGLDDGECDLRGRHRSALAGGRRCARARGARKEPIIIARASETGLEKFRMKGPHIHTLSATPDKRPRRQRLLISSCPMRIIWSLVILLPCTRFFWGLLGVEVSDFCRMRS